MINADSYTLKSTSFFVELGLGVTTYKNVGKKRQIEYVSDPKPPASNI